jgi:hypothetical protein
MDLPHRQTFFSQKMKNNLSVYGGEAVGDFLNKGRYYVLCQAEILRAILI